MNRTRLYRVSFKCSKEVRDRVLDSARIFDFKQLERDCKLANMDLKLVLYVSSLYMSKMAFSASAITNTDGSDRHWCKN